MFCAVIATVLAICFMSPALCLTIDEAVATGLKNNPELKAASFEEEAAPTSCVRACSPPSPWKVCKPGKKCSLSPPTP